MERTVVQVNKFLPVQPKVERVCGYTRVSSGKDAMLHSLSAQVSYFSNLIQNHSGWVYCGVYSDEAITGTKESRDGFQRMIEDCRAGKIDRVITKSISRFARNTVTLLETVRELKSLGVDVFFEEQNIHTMSADGELVITILASYAQEESLFASENQKWRIRKNFEEGKPWCGVMIGYRQENGQFVVVPEEAAIVKRIYAEYLDGNGTELIARHLNEDGIRTVKGFCWNKSAICRILRNYNYTGNLLLQRFYSENHLTKKKCTNQGELPQYHVENAHEAIISIEDYEAVQLELARRAEKYESPHTEEKYPFTGLITCAICGKHYRRKVTASRVVWICATYNSQGKAKCASKAIPEETLMLLASDFPFTDISAIVADHNNTVVFCLKDGRKISKLWKERSRAESWTPEKRALCGARSRAWHENNHRKERA